MRAKGLRRHIPDLGVFSGFSPLRFRGFAGGDAPAIPGEGRGDRKLLDGVREAAEECFAPFLNYTRGVKGVGGFASHPTSQEK